MEGRALVAVGPGSSKGKADDQRGGANQPAIFIELEREGEEAAGTAPIELKGKEDQHARDGVKQLLDREAWRSERRGVSLRPGVVDPGGRRQSKDGGRGRGRLGGAWAGCRAGSVKGRDAPGTMNCEGDVSAVMSSTTSIFSAVAAAILRS